MTDNFRGNTGPAWYCLRSQIQREELAMDSLGRLEGVEPFLPRLRVKRVRNRKMVWRTEPLFPGYLFARFELGNNQRAVGYANGVAGIVRFGAHWPAVASELISEMRLLVGEGDILEVAPTLCAGDEVRITSGPMEGFVGTVVRTSSGGMRVALLLDFLGQQTTVEVPRWEIDCERDVRRMVGA